MSRISKVILKTPLFILWVGNYLYKSNYQSLMNALNLAFERRIFNENHQKICISQHWGFTLHHQVNFLPRFSASSE